MSRVYGIPLAHDVSRVMFTPTDMPWLPTGYIADYIARRTLELRFNGPAWKLWEWTFSRSTGYLTIVAGPGRYADYKFTNLDPTIRRSYSSPRFWFNAIVPCGLCITGDDKIVLGMRREKINDDPHTHVPSTWDIPGGHPPEGLGPDLSGFNVALAHVVRREILSEIIHARPFILVDEIPTHGVNLVYLVRITETAASLPTEPTDQHKFFTYLDIDPDRIKAFFRDEWRSMGPPTYSALLYFGRESFGESWFEEVINMTAH
ncbi:MAG: hypothetical protein HYW91_03425 [Candidatus Sungbacteria bacterium]|nr:hypothetical protein [Candidatus Sungbacteria bacterium]